ncbi:hypothetical protein C8F01DRAFT_1128944 [Mycena amicta]|nr:hypothetical protein C8F01DRAFT_1128944 [Mycena amicta]
MERLRMGLGLGQWSYFSAEDSRSTTVGQILQTVSALREDAFKAYGFETSGNTSTNATIKLPFAWPTSQERNPPDEEDVFAFSDTDPDPPLTCATEDFTIQPYSSELKEYRILTRNRIACWRSHYSVLMQAVSQQTGWSSPVTLILEDDVDMELDIRARLGAVWGSLPPDWDVVFLGHCWSNESYYPAIPILHKEHNTLSRLHPSNAPLCTHGYAVSPAGASRLLVHLTHPPFAYSRAIDHALAWLVQSGRIQAYSVVPSVVVQRKIGSSDVMPDGRGSAWRESLTKGFFDVENLADPST